MSLFEGYERRIDQINEVCKKYGIAKIEDAKTICDEKGIDPAAIVKDLQPIAFENAAWAYTLGAAIAIKKGNKTAVEAAKSIGEGLQAFCVPGSVADHRKVGLGHGNLAAMLLSEDAGCFAFLAGHESFAAAEGTSSIFNVYAIVTDAQTTHDITVTALDENDQEVQTRTFEDVPLRNGYKTTYRGTFFIDTPASAGFTVDDWNEYDVVEF